ncbi:hypothetical protein [Thauera linaloolentis]|uniref:DUF4124 domain-containing protein n=1 Tax=Thauera linaloolentis (strain DSM 12138 / JCM 21573 / CCUG 41526 / CIP 105981 / IAM 15112 / NBRC 102519 / 47Lol) TaxID=1123367 RepID=N6YRY7_THAL4|nr:hypothetical protein [Thauera linaloolentis]ENO84933.1 hypothetical protein C666_16315 [Thauera linaloolentis 47Lol = DSM 12138]MCM8566792.1 hypothetical protein [Thauera linaloolentis]
MASRRAELRGAGAALAAALLVSGAAMAQAPGGRVIYCCDVGTQPVCGDILPAACYGRAYREVSPSGTVRRVVPAPLTAEEIARRDALERGRRADEAARLKQLRMDEALLETYRSLQHLDERRDREIGSLDRSINSLRQREAELLERQHALIEEAAQAGEGNVPPVTEDNIRSLDSEIVAQRSVIDAKMRERSAVLDRFDEDRQRYIQLTSPAAHPKGH